jgi:hypothetical protein
MLLTLQMDYFPTLYPLNGFSGGSRVCSLCLMSCIFIYNVDSFLILLHTHNHLHCALVRTGGPSLGAFKGSSVLPEIESVRNKSTSLTFILKRANSIW